MRLLYLKTRCPQTCTLWSLNSWPWSNSITWPPVALVGAFSFLFYCLSFLRLARWFSEGGGCFSPRHVVWRCSWSAWCVSQPCHAAGSSLLTWFCSPSGYDWLAPLTGSSDWLAGRAVLAPWWSWGDRGEHALPSGAHHSLLDVCHQEIQSVIQKRVFQ